MDPEQPEQNQASPEDKKDDNPEHINIKVRALTPLSFAHFKGHPLIRVGR
jgi:hypothetical protein